MGSSIVGIGFVRILVHGTVRAKPTALDLAVEWQTGEILDDRILQSARCVIRFRVKTSFSDAIPV